MARRGFDRLDDVVAQVAFPLARRFRDLLHDRQSRREARWKDIEMRLHVDRGRTRAGRTRPDIDDVIVAPVIGRAGNRLELIAQAGRLHRFLVGVVSRLILPTFIDDEPIGPSDLLQQVDFGVAGLLASRVPISLENDQALRGRIGRDIKAGDAIDGAATDLRLNRRGRHRQRQRDAHYPADAPRRQNRVPETNNHAVLQRVEDAATAFSSARTGRSVHLWENRVKRRLWPGSSGRR